MNIPARLEHLIGKQLDAKVVESKMDFNGKDYEFKSMKFGEGVIKAIQNEIIELGYSSIRLIYTGGVYTQDVRMNRLNVKINDSGVIEHFYFGWFL